MLTAQRFTTTRAPARAPAFAAVNSRQPAVMAGGAALIAALLALALIARGLSEGVRFAAFASYLVALALLAAAAFAGYWAWAISQLRYEVGRGALTIVWGFTRQIVPVANMERVVRGRALGEPLVDGLELPGWPCHAGRARVRRLGAVLLYSTHQTPAEILYVVTPTTVYGISPADPQALIRALQHAPLVGETEVRQGVERHPALLLPAWSDRFALAMAAAAMIVALAVIGVVFARYTGVPARTVVPFPGGDHEVSKRALLGIPLTAAVVLILNLGVGLSLHRQLRPIAYLLAAGCIFVEALLFVGALLAT